ncbi:MAG: protein phosphatase 2C domain-containing protein [Chloroflexota bacterium]|nr:protein phosphatase 2C domain-containing protein [Chloroflexota bacterium]
MKKLFGKHKKTQKSILETPTIPTKRLPGSQETTKPIMAVAKNQPDEKVEMETRQLLASFGQSVGIQRDHNEDTIFTLTTTLSSNETQLPFGLYIVADGMGGHQHGEIASEVAARTMVEHITNNLYRHLFSTNSNPPKTPLREMLHNGVQEAHNAILSRAPGGGTTLTTVIILDNQMAIAHVGDSRAYTVNPNGRMNAITRDHSLVKRLEELGQLTPEEAEIHPQRNVLYRALGQGEPFEAEIITSPTPDGYLLICSDGLWGVVSNEALGQIIKDSPTLSQACQTMVAAANEAGGPDNISVILVQLHTQ